MPTGITGRVTDNAVRAALDAATAALDATPAERAAVRRYQALEEASFNDFLRGHPVPPQLARDVIPAIRVLDGIVDRAALPRDLVLYRGISHEAELPPRETYPVVWAPATFLSFSLSRAVATEAADAGVVLRLPARTRQPGLWLPPLGYRRLVYEQEVLLPRGSFLMLLAWRQAGRHIEINCEVM